MATTKLKIEEVEFESRASRMEAIRNSKYPFFEIKTVGKGFSFPLSEADVVKNMVYYLNQQSRKGKIGPFVFATRKVSKTMGKVRREA